MDTLPPSFVEIQLQITKLCCTNLDNPYFSAPQALSAPEKSQFVGDETRTQTCRWTGTYFFTRTLYSTDVITGIRKRNLLLTARLGCVNRQAIKRNTQCQNTSYAVCHAVDYKNHLGNKSFTTASPWI